MTDSSVSFALDILDGDRRRLQSRDREVFAVLIQLHAYNLHLIGDVAKVIAYMCRLQPPEFVFVSFAVELESFAARQCKAKTCHVPNCMALRERVRQLKKQQQAMDDRRRQEMNRAYRGKR